MRTLARRIGGSACRRVDRPMDAFDVQRRLVVDDEPVIFDVGGHVGQTARHYRALFPKAHIHTFEPYTASFERLCVAVADDHHIEAHQLALSDVQGITKLHGNAFDATNSILKTDPQSAKFWGVGPLETLTTERVPTTTVDAFCGDRAIDKIDILKLDVQGAEYLVLQGATGMLRDGAISLVYMELIFAPTYEGQRPLHDYLMLLDRCGYQLFDLYNPYRKEMRLLQADLLFARRDDSADVSTRKA